MKRTLAVAVLAMAATPVHAHRLDEYLQGTILSVKTNRLEAQMTLTPGVAVFPVLIALIDTDADGTISEQERRVYAEHVLEDVSIGIDGQRLKPKLDSLQFPTLDEMREGRGEIQLDFTAELPRGGGNRKLTFENHHQSRIAAYQVNCLVSRDPAVRIIGQERNYWQSVYRLEYEQSNSGFNAASFALWFGGLGWLGVLWISLFKGAGSCWAPQNRSTLN